MAFDATNFKVTKVEDDSTKLLREARNIIEKGFCQNRAARCANGFQVSPTSQEAVAFCSLGALSRAFIGKSLPDSVYRTSVTRLAGAVFSPELLFDEILNSSRVVNYNDSHSKEEVLAMFDKAIGE